MRQIEPRDIQRPEPIVPYQDTLGKSQYESVAAIIICVSQIRGEWTPLETLPKGERLYLPDMLRSGHLEQTEEGYMLSQRTIERIAEKFPA